MPVRTSNYYRNFESHRAIIASDWFRLKYRTAESAFTRIRSLPFTSTMIAVLDRNRKSLDVKLKECLAVEVPFYSHQAFSKRRALIMPEAFREIHDAGIRTCYDGVSWETGQVRTDAHGLLCFAIDGIKFPLPNLPEYREKATCIGAGDGSPTALGSTCYDINNHLYADVSIGFDMDEREAAKRHVDNVLKLTGDPKKLLFVFDRGYISQDLVDFLEGRGVSYIFRCRSKFSVAIDSQETDDGLVILGDHEVRCVKVEIHSTNGTETETLVTNNRELTVDEMREHYWGRWKVETSYSTLKNHLEAANFSGTSWNSIQQDFYACAFIADMLMQFAAGSDIYIRAAREAKNNKYDYKTNLNLAVGVFTDAYVKIMCETNKAKRMRMMDSLMEEMERNPVPIRPNRSTPRPPHGARKVKFHHNQKSNV